MATTSEIVLSGYSTKQIERLLETNKDNLERRKRQATIAFDAYSLERDEQRKFDLYDLFSLVVREINAIESNVEMLETTLKARADRAMSKVREAVEANAAPRYPRTTKLEGGDMKRRNNVSRPSLAAFSKPSRVKARNKRQRRHNAHCEPVEGHRARKPYNRNRYRAEDLHV